MLSQHKSHIAFVDWWILTGTVIRQKYVFGYVNYSDLKNT